MATREDIAAATKLLSDNPESVMGGTGSKPKDDQTRVSHLRKCDGASDSDAVVTERVVESEVIVESTADVNGLEEERVVESEVIQESTTDVNWSEGELVKNSDEKNAIDENSLAENGECRSADYKLLNGSETDAMNVDEIECEGGTSEKINVRGIGFYVGDFVWGKIKSHPWWPGQVYDPKDASEFAMSRKQEGRLLVAFFGDGSCSWCLPSQLVPFVDKFSEMSRVSNSKSFLNAVQRATDEVSRLMELEMTCNCIPEEKKVSLAKPEVTNAGLRAGVVMPEVDVCRLSFPKYEPADVLQKVLQLAKVVSVGNELDVAVLRSWLSAFYCSKGGHQLPAYHAPFHIEGLEDQSKDANGAVEDFSVPIEVPILGPQEDDWLSSPAAGSVNSQAPSENKVFHKRKQRSVAELMGENKNMKPESRKLASAEEDTEVEKSTTTRKRKKGNDGELKEAGSEQPSSIEKRSKKRKAELSVSPMITDAKDDGADGGNKGKLSGRPNKIDVSAAENASEGRDDSETVSTPRERKKSKYLSPPYLNLASRVGNSSFKSVAQIEKNEATKIAQTEDRIEEQGAADSEPISKYVDNKSQEKMPNEPTGSLNTSVDTGTSTVKDDKKLSFPASDVDAPIDELLTELQHAALDPFYLSSKGSLDMVWAFISALRSSTYLHGLDYKLYIKSKTGGNQKSRPSQVRDISKKQSEDKSPKSADENTPRASKTQRKSDTKKSKKSAQTCVAKTTTETKEGKTFPRLTLTFMPEFPFPAKKDIVGLFRKFGSLNMKETKFEKDSHSVQIVYKNASDAETAFKSSSSQCPFGSENVNYELHHSPAGSKSDKSLSKVSSPPKRAPEKREASHPVDDLVSDLNTVKQRLEITTAIVENYHSKFSSEDKSSLKDEMKHLMEKIETVGDMVRIIAEKSTS